MTPEVLQLSWVEKHKKAIGEKSALFGWMEAESVLGISRAGSSASVLVRVSPIIQITIMKLLRMFIFYLFPSQNPGIVLVAGITVLLLLLMSFIC